MAGLFCVIELRKGTALDILPALKREAFASNLP